jgi:hypothetical protein
LSLITWTASAAVGLVDPHRARRPDAVGVQEQHDLPHDLLLGPGVGDAPRPYGTDAGHLPQPHGRGFDRVEHLVAEGPNELLCIDGPDTRDHAGAEVLLDSVDRRRRRGLQESGAELQSVGSVVDPLAAGGDPFSGGDRRRLTNDRHKVAMAARLRSENAKAALLVVEGDPLDEAGQDFLLFRLGGGGHRNRA